MAHRAYFTEEIAIKRNRVYRIVKATYKDTTIQVLKQELGSKDIYIRNIDCFYAASGWLFYAPTDKERYSNKTYGLEKWAKCKCNCSVAGYNDADYDKIMSLLDTTKYKEFNYILKYLKAKNIIYRVNTIFELLDKWTKDKKVEFLVKADLFNLALCDGFYNLTKKNQKTVIQKALQEKSATLKELLVMAKTNCSYDLVPFGGDSKLKNYLLKQSEYLDYYKDYLKMAKRLNKNINEDYWKYPKNLVEAHNKCAEEIRAVEEAERLIREEKEAKEFANKNKTINGKIKSIAKKTASLNQTVNGYEIVVAQSLEDIQEQAKTLAQCLITASYFKDHANKKCLLVFVKKGETRLATAQVFYDKEKPLGQFYADERDRDNCKPNKSITTAFNTWLNKTYLTSNLCVA